MLVNNAGIGTLQDSGDPPEERALATLEVNLFGAWRTTAAALPALLASSTTVYPGYIRTAIHADPERAGVSLEHLAREERLEDAVWTLLRACGGRPRRNLATSRAGAVELAVARHAPTLVDGLVARRVRSAVAAGKIASAPFGPRAPITPESSDVEERESLRPA